MHRTPGGIPRGRPAFAFWHTAGVTDSALDPAAPDPETPATPVICSRRGCRRPATWELGWNNPKLHTSDRRKVWIACDEHRDYLADHLRLRGFLLDVTRMR